MFNAGLVFTPGGDDRINSLQDEDVLTGTGTNPTLNFTFGNPNDNGSTSIGPTLNGISTVNVAFSANNGGAVGLTPNTPIRLDLQDATGLTNAVNITRVSDTSNNVQVDNLLAAVTNLSIANSNSGTAVIGINFADGALAGAADATTLTLNRVNVLGLSIEDTDAAIGANLGTVGLSDGYETINLVSTGAANSAGTFSAEDLRTLNISGTQNLTLGGTNNTVVAAGGLVEATRFNAGLANVAGSLTAVNASTLTGNLTYNIGTEITAFADNTSGVLVNLSVTGGTGNDTFRLAVGSGVQAADRIDGGTGNNTLTVVSTAAVAGTVSNVQNLEIRGGHDNDVTADNIDVNATVITALTNTFIRNEGQDGALGGNGTSRAEALIARLHSTTAAQATNITVAHGTTGNNALFVTNQAAGVGANTAIGAGTTPVVPGPLQDGVTRINLDVGAGVTTAGITLVDGINTNARFNFSLAADSDTEAGTSNANGIQANNRNTTNTVANINIVDNDSESNTIELVEFGRLASDNAGIAAGHSGTITISGSSTGFLNLDATRNAYRYDLTGAGDDGGTVSATAPNSNGLPTFGHRSGTTDQYGERLIATNFNSTAYAGSLVIRVADSDLALGGQSILFGAGNDTVIFDQVGVTAVNRRTAGLSISDTVSGGAGNDILALDGNIEAAQQITIGASEWTNVSGFEIIRLVGNSQGATGANLNTFAQIANGGNAYNLTLTNELLTANGAADGASRRITIVNDNDSSNDVTTVLDDANGRAAIFGASGVESGVNIDARALTANNTFSYHGEEGASRTEDRFIVSDANLNGTLIIDGGRVYGAANVASNLANADVLDVRNNAVVTLGDLLGLRNIGNFEFRNDLATPTSALLELNSDTIDRLVNDSRAADATNIETLRVSAFNNPLLATATTNFTLEGASATSAFVNLIVNTEGGNDRIFTGAGADTINTGNGNDTVNGNGGNDTIDTGEGDDRVVMGVAAADIDAIVAGNGNDTFVLTGAAAGPVVIDLTAGDQLVSINGAAEARAQGGFENVDASAMTGGNVTVTGTGGVNTIIGTALADVITAGGGADQITGGLGADRIVQGTADSVAISVALANGNFANGDVLTFGNGVDVVNGFVAGAGGDILDLAANGAAVTAIGVANNALVAGTNYFLAGTFVGNVFTVAAAGSDTLVFQGFAGAGADIDTNTSSVVLVGVTAANLVAANIV